MPWCGEARVAPGECQGRGWHSLAPPFPQRPPSLSLPFQPTCLCASPSHYSILFLHSLSFPLVLLNSPSLILPFTPSSPPPLIPSLPNIPPSSPSLSRLHTPFPAAQREVNCNTYSRCITAASHRPPRRPDTSNLIRGRAVAANSQLLLIKASILLVPGVSCVRLSRSLPPTPPPQCPPVPAHAATSAPASVEGM